MALKILKSAILLTPILIAYPSLNLVDSTSSFVQEVSIVNTEKLKNEITNDIRMVLLNEEEIKFYIAKHRDLGSLLEEAKKHIASIFPNKTTLILDMFKFVDEDQDILSVRIENNEIEYDDMAGNLDKFNEKWWIENIQKAHQRLTFEV
jgi:hypothetical protein